MSGSGHQQHIYTIQESTQYNDMNGSNQTDHGQHVARASPCNQEDNILIDTSSIPLTQQHQMPPIQHHHQPMQPQNSMHQQHADCADYDDQQITPTPATITSQPGATSSRVAPENQNVVYSVHPMFNILDQHDTLLMRQRADPTSTCCGFESENTYTVRGKDGAPVLKALEHSNCCERCCFEGNREYNLSLVFGDETVARIRKPYRLSRFCCYSNAVRIESPEDNPIGYISQQFTLFGHARYAIFDCQQSSKTPTFLLKSTSCRFCFTPFLCTCLCRNKEFKIISVEHCEEVGTIWRHWQHESPTTANNEAATLDGLGADSTEMQLKPSSNQHDQQLSNDLNQVNRDQDEHDQQQLGHQEIDHNNIDNNNNISSRGHEQTGTRKSSKSPAKSSSSNQVFGIQFEPNLEARHKVLLLSACFMMDFFYFENDRRRRKLASC